MSSLSIETALEAFWKRVKPCPEPNGGVHSWLFHAACVAVDVGLPDDEAIAEIEDRMSRSPEPASEIEDALASARGERRRLPAWPKVNTEQVEAITRHGPSLSDLWKASPVKLPITNANRADSIIEVLFPGDPFLCVGHSTQDFETKRKSELLGTFRDRALIVASPMIAATGKTQKGHMSAHTLDNTGRRRFLVIEFDRGSLDTQAALIAHLSEIAPSLALVVFSGGKSVHSWFYCANQPEEIQLRFMRYAVSLGADRATWTRSQFVRIPDGTRRDGKTSAGLAANGIHGVPPGKQVALYLNPEVVQS